MTPMTHDSWWTGLWNSLRRRRETEESGVEEAVDRLEAAFRTLGTALDRRNEVNGRVRRNAQEVVQVAQGVLTRVEQYRK